MYLLFFRPRVVPAAYRREHGHRLALALYFAHRTCLEKEQSM